MKPPVLRRVRGRSRARTAETGVIRLEAQDVAYVLKRSERRSFALQIDHRGVQVAVPWAAAHADVERFIRGHERWLLDKLRARASHVAPRVMDLADGALFPLLGETCRLRFDDKGRAARWRGGADGVEELVLPPAADPAKALVRALRKRALQWFVERVVEYCFRLGRAAPDVHLSSARTRWGSCSSISGIRLHWRLVHLSPTLIDYVVAHEVAHLVEMNHSARFWDVVGGLFPDWKEARLRLREGGRMLPVIESRTSGESFRDD